MKIIDGVNLNAIPTQKFKDIESVYVFKMN